MSSHVWTGLDPDSLPIVGKDNLLAAPYLDGRDRRILLMMAQGKTNEQITRIIHVEAANAVTRLFNRLKAYSRCEAVAAGFRYGFLYWTDEGRLEIVP